MANSEEENNLPNAGSVSAVPSKLDSLLNFGQDSFRKAFESTNAVAAPPSTKTLVLPQLAESKRTAFKVIKGKITGYEIMCCVLPGGHLAEKNTAYDFLLMANAAAQQGKTLLIRSAFRDMATQTRLWNERQVPGVAKTDGVAAFPGTSNHQTGIALDLVVGLKKQEYLAGKTSDIFKWLETYAASFGFDHAEGKNVGEPWHWTHLEERIVGTSAFQSATGIAVLTANTAVNATASNQAGNLLVLNRDTHDATTEYARSQSFPGSSRTTLRAEQSLFDANKSNYINNYVADVEKARLALSETPKGFDKKTLDPFVFNFTTGLWGDGEPV